MLILILLLALLTPNRKPSKKRAKKERQPGNRAKVIEWQTREQCLALIHKYYPLLKRARILRCCANQRAGNYKVCCRDRLCPPCTARESHVRAVAQHDVFWRFSTSPWPVIAQEVHTLPPQLHAFVENPAGLRKWRQASMKTLHDLYGPNIAGVSNLHPIGDKNLTRTHYHFDILLNAFTLQDGVVKPERFDVRYDTGRAVYRRNLEQAFDVHLDEVDIWFGPPKRTIAGQYPTWRAVKYSARNVYQPAFARIVEGAERDWKYKPKRREMALTFPGKDVIRTLLHVEQSLYAQPRHVWFGYLKDKARKKADAAFIDARQTRRARPKNDNKESEENAIDED